MKYEIIKGSEKDFEKVDKVDNRNVWTHIYKDESGVFYSSKEIEHISRLRLVAERRPITEPVVNQQLTTEWDGEGLPPVGALCRYRAFSGMPWVECEVLGWHGDDAWLKRTVDGITFVMGDQELFPIRSPEDVARDEVIANICFEIGVRPNNIVVQQTYDAIAAGNIKGVVLESKEADLKINTTTDEMWREFEKKSDMEDVRKLMMDSLAEQRVAFNKSRHSSF